MNVPDTKELRINLPMFDLKNADTYSFNTTSKVIIGSLI